MIYTMRKLEEAHIDALQELINIGVGRAANLLNQMLGSRIFLKIPSVQVLSFSDLQKELKQRFDKDDFAAVRLNFTGSFSGKANLIFPTTSASKLVSVLTGEDADSPDLDSVKIGTLSEVGNIVINGIMGSISNVLNQHLNYALPTYLEDSIEQVLSLDNVRQEAVFLLAQASFEIENLELMGDIVLIFEMDSFDVLIDAINKELGLGVL
ncbi:MAG: chemotaxis protein CheC [Scytonematopsis contorta HA4267-MV1]|nr:chemotaxis protein CheC [Scytonematopsis contorta HA4267-MV1]